MQVPDGRPSGALCTRVQTCRALDARHITVRFGNGSTCGARSCALPLRSTSKLFVRSADRGVSRIVNDRLVPQPQDPLTGPSSTTVIEWLQHCSTTELSCCSHSSTVLLKQQQQVVCRMSLDLSCLFFFFFFFFFPPRKSSTAVGPVHSARVCRRVVRLMQAT